MSQKMVADLLFLDPNDVNAGTAALIEHGFDVEVLDLVDPYGPTVFLRARIMSELNDYSFLDWVNKLVSELKLSGDVIEAGYADADQPRQ